MGILGTLKDKLAQFRVTRPGDAPGFADFVKNIEIGGLHTELDGKAALSVNSTTGGVEVLAGGTEIASFQKKPVSAAPARVSGVVAYAGNTSALVRWDFLDPYSTYAIKAGGVVVGTAQAGATSALITGLTNGTAYAFTVSAQNSADSSLDSLASNSVTPGVGPVANLPPMALWLDANQLGLANGANVTTWADKSGAGRNAISSGTGYQTFAPPTFLASWANGKPAVTFNGQNMGLSISGLLASVIGASATIFIVGDCAALTNSGSSANQQIISNQKYVAQPLWNDQIGLSVNTNSGNFNITSAGGLSGSAAIALNTPTILSANLPGNAYANGTKEANLVSGLVQSNSNVFAIGSNPNGTSLAFNGHIAEIIIFPQQLTQAQRWAVEAYLAAKYGVSVVQQ